MEEIYPPDQPKNLTSHLTYLSPTFMENHQQLNWTRF